MYFIRLNFLLETDFDCLLLLAVSVTGHLEVLPVCFVLLLASKQSLLACGSRGGKMVFGQRTWKRTAKRWSIFVRVQWRTVGLAARIYIYVRLATLWLSAHGETRRMLREAFSVPRDARPCAAFSGEHFGDTRDKQKPRGRTTR